MQLSTIILFLMSILTIYLVLNQPLKHIENNYHKVIMNKTIINSEHISRFVCSTRRLKTTCKENTIFCQRFLLKIKVNLYGKDSLDIIANYTTNDHFNVSLDDMSDSIYMLFDDPLLFDHSHIYCNKYYEYFSSIRHMDNTTCHNKLMDVIGEHGTYYLENCFVL